MDAKSNKKVVPSLKEELINSKTSDSPNEVVNPKPFFSKYTNRSSSGDTRDNGSRQFKKVVLWFIPLGNKPGQHKSLDAVYYLCSALAWEISIAIQSFCLLCHPHLREILLHLLGTFIGLWNGGGFWIFNGTTDASA